MTNNNFFKRLTIPPFPVKSRDEPDPIPTKIGPYRIDTLLDKGGMSLLYLGTHPEIPVPITIKVLSPKYLSHPEMTAHFLKEAEIIALADHPNIVKLFGYGEWEGGLYIAMEFIQGASLRQYILQNPLSLKRSVEMILEIAYALCHLHTHGVIHRDLKPENILVNQAGHTKLIDFGIAQLIDPMAAERVLNEASKGRLVGTPTYMSPEQRENPENVSYPSDIYSLGIIAYELVLGKFSQGQVQLSLVPKGLQKILSKMLQPAPSNRYQDIVDLISDLSAYLHSPQFDMETKMQEQPQGWLDITQDVQEKLSDGAFQSENRGFAIHRPWGDHSLYVNSQENLLVLVESSAKEMEGLLQLVYIKGSLDAFLSQNVSWETLAEKLNQLILTAPISTPLALALIQEKVKDKAIEILSCGFGSTWKIGIQGIEMLPDMNSPLGLEPNLISKKETLILAPNEKLLICPSISSFSNAEQFTQLLEDLSSLPPQQLATAVLRKLTVQNPQYFDEHPFVIAVFG